MIPMFIAYLFQAISFAFISVFFIKQHYQPVDAAKMKVIVAAFDYCQQPVVINLRSCHYV